MRLIIAAVGRLKDGPEREIYARYAERLDGIGRGLSLGPMQMIEIPECRAGSADARKSDEARRLLAKVAGKAAAVALDERGKVLSSEAFARLIRGRRDAGAPALAFLIGGADGHGQALLDAAEMRLSLGPMTLPHGLARLVLVEQLYRAATIIAGHPYHRA